jgi:hypothetical protein
MRHTWSLLACCLACLAWPGASTAQPGCGPAGPASASGDALDRHRAQLLEFLGETESPEAFALALKALEAAGADAGDVFPVAFRNAERLGLIGYGRAPAPHRVSADGLTVAGVLARGSQGAVAGLARSAQTQTSADAESK